MYSFSHPTSLEELAKRDRFLVSHRVFLIRVFTADRQVDVDRGDTVVLTGVNRQQGNGWWHRAFWFGVEPHLLNLGSDRYTIFWVCKLFGKSIV